MAANRFVVGIDLGTTHTAMAYADLRETPEPVIFNVEIPQTVRAGAVEKRKLLPSCIYLPAENELPEGSLALPWPEAPLRTAAGAQYTVGEFARTRGAEVPGRLISSAKSWLCQTGTDRRSALLPFDAPRDVARISPVEACALLLSHLRRTWDFSVLPNLGCGPLAEQKIVLCVPSSFDAAARDLTLEAAKLAGLADITLLEEPQAAFYAWIEHSREEWRNLVRIGDDVLVVDIGGGTTDFSLIAVEADDGALGLRRVAAGEHILLGGDTMDLALAHLAAERLGAGAHLDGWQLRALALACREAKEKLFEANGAQDDIPVAVLGRGRGVIGDSLQTKLNRAAASAMIEEGFFERCGRADRPRTQARGGIRELGLNFASDSAVTRHLAKFLAEARGGKPVAPTAILFNGGVMKAARLRERITSVLGSWNESGPEQGPVAPRVLCGGDLELAVARGAAFYGLVQRGRGVRIRGGIPRSYYVGVEAASPQVPGRAAQLKALCVASIGMEEGSEVEVPRAEFGLVVGEPAQFRFLTSTTRRNDVPGDAIENWNGSFQELEPLEAILSPTPLSESGALVRVRLSSKVTEVGTLELWCREHDGPGAWKLELNVR